MSERSEHGGIITGFMVKLVLSLVVLGILFADGGSILFNRIGLQGSADEAASEGAAEVARTRSARSATLAVVTVLKEIAPTAKLAKGYPEVRSDGSVKVVITRRAGTIVAGRINVSKPWTIARAEAVAQPPQN